MILNLPLVGANQFMAPNLLTNSNGPGAGTIGLLDQQIIVQHTASEVSTGLVLYRSEFCPISTTCRSSRDKADKM